VKENSEASAQPGDPFPRLTISITNGQPVAIPDAFAGDFAFVLFYRGSVHSPGPACDPLLSVSGCGKDRSVLREVGGRAVESLPGEEDVDFLVVEGDQPGDGQQLPGREVVAPGDVGMSRTAD
jgi:hypothetical protein